MYLLLLHLSCLPIVNLSLCRLLSICPSILPTNTMHRPTSFGTAACPTIAVTFVLCTIGFRIRIYMSSIWSRPWHNILSLLWFCRFKESRPLLGLEVVTSSSLGDAIFALIGWPNCTNQSQTGEGGQYIWILPSRFLEGYYNIYSTSQRGRDLLTNRQVALASSTFSPQVAPLTRCQIKP